VKNVTAVMSLHSSLPDLAEKSIVMEVAATIHHIFSVSISQEDAGAKNIVSSGKRIPFTVTSPPEFGGSETDWSPEHLMAASVASCYSNTFCFFSKLLKIKVHSFSMEVEMEVEKEKKGPFIATRFILRPEIKFAEAISGDTIDNLLKKAKKYCIISNSVKGEVIIQPQIEIC
jgi:organic hydroperoxide reductase OsmC/OhrA